MEDEWFPFQLSLQRILHIEGIKEEINHANELPCLLVLSSSTNCSAEATVSLITCKTEYALKIVLHYTTQESRHQKEHVPEL